LAAGDAIITNDPYVSGSHLPDICMISPVFVDGRCIGLLANLAHHVDVGGITPGSMPTISSEIFQEGLRIPPVRLKRGGEVDEEMMQLIANNVRTPYETIGDFQAQFAANNVGERRLKEIIAKYGPAEAAFYMRELINYSERRMLSAIGDLPRGRFEFEDYLEGDGFSERQMTIRAAVDITSDTITVDFTGTSPQAKGSVNSTRAVTLACVYFALKSVIDPELPSSAGAFKPVRVITPKGSLVNPRFPAPVSNANINTAQRIADVILGALAQGMPERVPAASTGSMSIFTIGGANPESGLYYSYVETYGGGQGAVYNADGMDGVHTNMTNTRNTPVEVIEIAYPLRVEKYGLVSDTDGAGRFRGGLGLTREITILEHEATISIGTERRKIKPWGLAGGQPGGPSQTWIVTPQGETQTLPTKVTTILPPGTKIVLQTAGAGGYGDPFTRDSMSVATDVAEGFITAARAREAYGVAIDQKTGTPDEPLTKTLRQKQHKEEPA
jgi:N-methylhydantoinase B